MGPQELVLCDGHARLGSRRRRNARRWSSPPYVGAPTAEQELYALKGQVEYFGGALEDIKKRMEELEAGKKAE